MSKKAKSAHPAAIDAATLLADCQIRKTRRSGPGGQHRNKVETAVVITHTPSGIVAEANERRSQEQNRKVALFRLRLKLALAVREDRTTDPSDLWRTRVSGGRIAVSATHEDFPAMLAEAMDSLQSCEFDLKRAATRLAVTSSQLTKFLKSEPAAFSWLNVERAKLELPRLR